MLVSFSDYVVNNLIDQLFRAQTPLQPATVYVGLLIAPNGIYATSTVYGAGAYITALTSDGTYHLYHTVAGGTSASSPTTFPGVPNESVTDNTVTWVEQTSVLKAAGAALDEVSVGVGAYTRIAVISSLLNWAGTQAALSTTASTGTSGQTSNNSAITWAAPTGNWAASPAVIWGIALFDAASGGDLLAFGPIGTPTQILSGALAPTIPVSDLTFTML